jgi:hypothetical protein
MYLNLEENDLDKPIYRIIPYKRLIELFQGKENVLVKPISWEDTFENFAIKAKLRAKNGDVLQYNIHERMYGQCWSMNKASDAMWRIYSQDKLGIRIKTTINKLLDSICETTLDRSNCEHCIGKVEYLFEKELTQRAKSTFGKNGEVSFGNLFRSLLVKRKAFVHEKEIRLIFLDWGDGAGFDKLFKYSVDPHYLLSQLMVDPRVPYEKFKELKVDIQCQTGFKGDIKRSLLYRLPKDVVIDIEKSSHNQAFHMTP